MNINEYQEAAVATAMYENYARVLYPTLGLCGEAGEVAEKIKKRIRDHGGNMECPEFKRQITRELGDVLWYIANIADDLGISLAIIAQTNLDKLADRKQRDMLSGSGDDR